MKTYLLKAGVRQAIAKAGETDIAVAYNAKAWIDEYPAGNPQLMVTTPGGKRVPMTVETVDNLITGQVPNELLAGPGVYSYVFVWTSGSTQLESGRCECLVLGSNLAKDLVHDSRRTPEWAERIFLAAEVIESAVNGAMEARNVAADMAAEAADSAEEAGGYKDNAADSAEAAAASAATAQDILDSIPEDYTTLSNDVGDLKSAIDTIVPNQMLGITYEWGNTNASGVPATEATNQHRISSLIPVKAGTKVLFKASNTYNTAEVITLYTADGVFSTRTVYAIDKDTADVVVDIPIDGYIRRSYALKTGNAMTEDIDLHIRDLWELSIDDRPTKTLNTIEKVYDYDSQALNFGYISKTTGTKTTTDRWKYVIHDCKQGDVFVYNGLCVSPAAVAIFFNSTNRIIGYVGSEDSKTFYKDYVIRIPFFCTRVCFNWFTAEGYNPCNVYRFITNTDLPTSIRQNDILGLIGYDRYKGLKININGDSISTPTAGKWSNFIQNQIDCTFKTIGIGGTVMTGEINSTTRIANLDADADIVLTNGGANDWAQNVTIGSLETLDDPTTFAGAVQLYIERVMTQCPNARIICMGTNYVNFKNRFSVDPLIGEKNDNGDRITDFNEMYRKVCEYNSVEFINIYELCGINRYNYTTYLEQNTHDYGYGYIHPNNEGGKKYLDVILAYLFYGKNS